MVGRQIRLGGLMYPIYTITAWLSPTSILIDQQWAGPDAINQSYQLFQSLYPVPADFNYMYAVTSIKDSYQLWTNLSEADLSMLDPQRTNFGQTYACVYSSYTPQYGGVIGPVIPVTNPVDPAPISTTSTGFTFVASATYIIQVVIGGQTGAATFQWLRSGQVGFQPSAPTSDQPQDLSDGVQIYWPDGQNYVSGDLFIINCRSEVSQSTPRYELWPAPTFSGYIYPYIYTKKEYDLTVAQPQLPPFIANRGEILLEMALEKCAEFPGQDAEHLNIYHDLKQAAYHGSKAERMMVDLERNDEEVGISLIDYEIYPFAPAPWMDGQWQQNHSPYLG